MEPSRVYLYIFAMAAVTYLIRVLPIVLIRRQIESRFVRSFLYYMPYATLSAMTFPAILWAGGSLVASAAGFIVAAVLGITGRSLPVVSLFACLAAFVFSFLGG